MIEDEREPPQKERETIKLLRPPRYTIGERIITVLALMLVIGGTASFFTFYIRNEIRNHNRGMGIPMRLERRVEADLLADTNYLRALGERVYVTRVGQQRRDIEFRLGPDWFEFYGVSCISCHGDNATEEVDIRHKTLVARGYDEDAFGELVALGMNVDGRMIGDAMPRFSISVVERKALFEYLKSFTND